MFNKIPRAPSTEDSSSGELIAALAATVARLSPVPRPIPISEVPAFFKIIFTSAKSVLMRPGVMINPVIPTTPSSRTWSAVANAANKLVLSLEIVSKRSFGITISVSTFSRSFEIPASACNARRRPSKLNGRVTMPTVSAPAAREISAMTGAAPVPVPPPSPAVMNTMSAPATSSSISARLDSAASRPTSGSLPAPRPRVNSRPISIFTSASLIMSACASVLIAMNSTPFIPESIMRCTALMPPPPTPITLITARKLCGAPAILFMPPLTITRYMRNALNGVVHEAS